MLPRTHGSSLFTRGETQALVVTTLGTGDDEQMIDALHGTWRSNFLLHYNFPPYSVGEAGRMGAPGRREIGHGKLAWRALQAVLPAATDFPYTIRVVSEITEFERLVVDGDGLRLVAQHDGRGRAAAGAGGGRRHGLILEGERFAVLTDILGDEDHLGDMDFKVAGTGGHHLAADGHQGRGHHARDHGAGARAGEGRADAHPRRDGQGAVARAGRSSRRTPRGSRP